MRDTEEDQIMKLFSGFKHKYPFLLQHRTLSIRVPLMVLFLVSSLLISTPFITHTAKAAQSTQNLTPNNIGSVLWSKQTGGTTSVYERDAPVVANGIVYYAANDGYLWAWKASDGSILWHDPISSAFNTMYTPVVANGIVYADAVSSSLYALDANTGALIWPPFTPPPSTTLSSPPTVADGIVYVNAGLDTVYALNASTGQPEPGWTCSCDPVDSGIAVANGVVYVGTTTGLVDAVTESDGTLIQTFQTFGPVRETPVVANGVLYVTSEDGVLYAFHAATTTPTPPPPPPPIWTFSPSSCSSQCLSFPPTVANGIVYFINEQGLLYALNASGVVIWQKSGAISPVAVENGIVYVSMISSSSLPSIDAFDASTGTPLWLYPTGTNVYPSTPAVSNGVVYFGALNTYVTLYAVIPPIFPAVPILFVHGFSATCQDWQTAKNFLENSQPSFMSGPMIPGWSQSQMVTVGYYDNPKNPKDLDDSSCGDNLADTTLCQTYYYTPQDEGTLNEDIRHIACEFAWYIYKSYTLRGQSVDIVPYSMGGLITRWALACSTSTTPPPPCLTNNQDPFPPVSLLVQSIVDQDSPQGGIPLTSIGSSTVAPAIARVVCNGCTQFTQMVAGSDFMNDINNYAQDPQGTLGTNWTLIGSQSQFDGSLNSSCFDIPSSSAVYMNGTNNIVHKYVYDSSSCYWHESFVQRAIKVPATALSAETGISLSSITLLLQLLGLSPLSETMLADPSTNLNATVHLCITCSEGANISQFQTSTIYPHSLLLTDWALYGPEY